MNITDKPRCANVKLAEYAGFEKALDSVLSKLREELLRQVKLQQAGRFERACSDPSHTDASSYAIAMEEYLESMGAFDEIRKEMTERVLGVTKAMQDENKSEEHLKEEILQTAATFAGWLISRERNRNSRS